MLLVKFKYTFSFLLLLLSGILSAQHQNLPYDKWIDQLSVKTDLKTVNLFSVRDQLFGLDTMDCLFALRELGRRGSMHQNKRFNIRFNFLQLSMGHCYSSNPEEFNPLESSKEALRLAYELEDEFLIALANKNV